MGERGLRHLNLRSWSKRDRDQGLCTGTRRVFRLGASLAVAGALSWLAAAWWWTEGKEPEGGDSTLESVGLGRPVLSLECAELGIGTGKAGGIVLILDDAGIIRPPGETAAAGWPTFTFGRVPGLIIGQRNEEPLFATAAGIAGQWVPLWEGRFGPVVRMVAQSSCCLRVETAGGVTLEFVAADLERQFRNLESIWRHSEKEGREIATVNLMPARNAPVTWR